VSLQDRRNRIALLDGEARRNTEPDPKPGRVICANATGCEYDQDGECPYGTFRSCEDPENKTCPVAGKPVNWRED
jgi:hypothetical protein